MRMNKKIQALFVSISIMVTFSIAGCGRGHSKEKYLIWEVVKTPDGSEQKTFMGVADHWSLELLDEDIKYLGKEYSSENRKILADSVKSSIIIAIQWPPKKSDHSPETQYICKSLFPYYLHFSSATLLGRVSNCYEMDHNGKIISDPTEAIVMEDLMDDKAYCDRGVVYSENGWYDLAISDYTKAIEMNPQFAKAFYERGVAYYWKGRHDLAISDYARTVNINPRFKEPDDILIELIREKWARHKKS